MPTSIIGSFGVDVSARLQPRQPVADGADDLDRLRGRRRDRRARKRLAPHRRWACRACRRRSAARAKSASPSFRSACRSSRCSRRCSSLGGIVGRLFREFALTLSIAVLISMAVSLTTTPMMCALHPAARTAGPWPPLSRRPSACSTAMLAFYRTHPSRVALRHPRMVALSLLATVGLNYYMFATRLNYGLFPVQDTGLIDRLDPGRSEHFVPVDAARSSRSCRRSFRTIRPSTASSASPAAGRPIRASSISRSSRTRSAA